MRFQFYPTKFRINRVKTFSFVRVFCGQFFPVKKRDTKTGVDYWLPATVANHVRPITNTLNVPNANHIASLNQRFGLGYRILSVPAVFRRTTS